jgi:hypothetical protein
MPFPMKERTVLIAVRWLTPTEFNLAAFRWESVLYLRAAMGRHRVPELSQIAAVSLWM